MNESSCILCANGETLDCVHEMRNNFSKGCFTIESLMPRKGKDQLKPTAKEEILGELSAITCWIEELTLAQKVHLRSWLDLNILEL